MATYKGILTNNGKALLASATVANPVNYSHLAVGDGNGSTPTPLETRSALVNEKARIALNVVEINPNQTNQIICEAIIPTNVGGFHIREFGLFAGSVMVVNGNYPLTYKPAVNEGGAREIAIKVIINVQNAEVIALYLDDSLIYATREWVKNNYIPRADIIDNLTTNDATKPVSAKQAKVLNDKVESIEFGAGGLKDKVEKTDPRLSDPREWTAETVSQAEAESGAATTRRAWTAQRVRQAATAMFNAATTVFTRTLLSRSTAAQVRSDLGLGNASTSSIVNNLTTNDANSPLSAAMGFALSEGKLDKNSNAVSASRLQTPRLINISGQASGLAEFDGSKNINIDLAVRYATNSDIANNCIGNSNTASRLQTPRLINISGQASGLAEFDGSKNINIDLAVRYATNSDLAQNANIAHNALGFEQQWKNRNTIRYPNTTYINSENRTIFVTVTKKNQAGVAKIYTSGIEIAKIGGNSTDFHSFSFPVLAHMSYRVDADLGIEIWSEVQ